MKTHCLPFSQIPHTESLFLDYLSCAPAIRSFYPRSPQFAEWLNDEAKRLRYDDTRRSAVARTLERQNREFGSGSKTFANIERLKQGAMTAVTGQQVGLFGGPLFSIFKALSAIKLAEQATAAGVECVPIFWFATEDHDFAEINHVSLMSEAGLERLQIENHDVAGAPVGKIKLGPETEAVVERAASLLGDTEVANWLREAYHPGATLGNGFARLMAQLFEDWGVILLDQYDPGFHKLAKPIFRKAIERSAEIDEGLITKGKALEAAGYHQQVKVTAATTLLFEIREGVRTPLRRKSNGTGEAEFVAGESRSSMSEVLERIDRDPLLFSPNVLLRPVVQDFLLPTLTYSGGPAEVAYFAQAAVVYEKLLGRVTPVLPRFSATIVEAKAQRLLERYRMDLPDLFVGPEKLREVIAARTLPSDLQTSFGEAQIVLEKSLGAIRETLARLDSTLVDAASNAEEKMKYQLTQLQARASRAEAQRNEVITRHADSLSNMLYPNKNLQEREVGGVSFMARYGPQLLQDLYAAIHTDCNDHQIAEI